MIILESFPSTVLGGFKMQRQTHVRDPVAETAPPPAPPGVLHCCGTLPTLLCRVATRTTTAITGNKLS